MNIQVIKDKLIPPHLVFTGGEYGVAKLDIYIDPELPLRTQRMLVIHCLIEDYFRSIEHSKVEELCGFIEEALDMIEE